MENEDDSLPYIDDTTDDETNNNHYNLKIIENYQNKNRNIKVTNAYPYDITNKPLNSVAPLADEDDVNFQEDTIKHPVKLSPTGMKLVIKSWNSSVSIQGLDNKSSITFQRNPEKARKRTSRSEERKVKSESEDVKVVEKPKKGRWKVLTRSLMLAKSSRLDRRGLDERYPKYVLLKNEEEEPPKLKESYPKMFTFEKKSDFKENGNIEPKSEFSFKKSFKNKTKPIVSMEEILKQNTSTIEPEMVKRQKKVLTETKYSLKKIERRKSLSLEKLTAREDDKQEKNKKCPQGHVVREIQGIIEDTLKLVPPNAEGIHQETDYSGCHSQEKQAEYNVSPQFCQYSCHDPYCTARQPSTYVPVYAQQAQPRHVYRNVNTSRKSPINRPCEIDAEHEADIANLQFGFLSSFFPRVLILKAVQEQSLADETEMTKDLKPLSQNEKAKVEVEEEYAKPVETLEVPQQDLTLKSKLVQDVTVTDPEVEFYMRDLNKTDIVLNEDQKTKTDDSETTEYLHYCEFDPLDNESVERMKISTPPSPGRDKINDENSKNLTLTKIGYKMYDNLTKLSLNREKEIIEKAEVSGCGCNGNKAKKLPCNITLESNNNVVKVTVPENEINFQILNSERADILIGVTSGESKNNAKEEEEKNIVRKDELWHSDGGKRAVVLRHNQRNETDITSGSQKLKLSLADDKEILLSIEMNEKNKKQDTIKPKLTKETKVGTDDFDLAGGDFICTFGENYKNLSPRTAHLLKSLHEKLKIGEQERKFLEEKINQKITDQIYENKILPGLFLIKQIIPRPQICKKPAETSLRKVKKETEKENRQLREYYCEDCLATMRIFEDANPSVKSMVDKFESIIQLESY